MKGLRYGAGALAWLAFPTGAHAHGAIPGMEGVANGLLHPVTTPAHVLIILAFGLLVAQQRPVDLKGPLVVFVPALAAGLLLTLAVPIAAVYLPVLLVVALGCAVLVAWQRAISVWGMRVLAAVSATVIGLDSGIEARSIWTALKTLLGTWIAVSVLVFNVGYYGSLAVGKAEWLRVGIRVLGSWIIAISFLMLAFSMRSFRTVTVGDG